MFGYVGTPTSKAAISIIDEAGIPLVGPFTGAGFYGIITELHWYDKVLSSENRSSLYNGGYPIKGKPLQIESDNLVGYWALDDVTVGQSGNGKTFTDGSSNGNDGTGSGSNLTSVEVNLH